MNFLDKVIASINPRWAIERAQWRRRLQAYEAAEVTRMRKFSRISTGPNTSTRNAIQSLREQSRWLDQSHDLVNGILDTFVNNTIGPNGIQIEPQPKNAQGEIESDFAQQILMLWRDWSRKPETRHMHDRGCAERLAALTWARDGECFAQHISGQRPQLDHGTEVPYSIELLDPEMVPHDYEDSSRNVVQGVLLNEWGRPRTYYVYKKNPAETLYLASSEMKQIPAELMAHLKLTRRIGQVRGVSKLATVLTRIQDLKDYEESERVSARISAAMCAYVRKGTPDMYLPTDAEMDGADDDGNRLFDIAPGMVWDNLLPGEEIGTVQSNRPSNLLAPFRDSMLKAVASGVGVGYSSIAKDYSGTYSAQRQELVESYVSYAAMTAHFVSQWTRPIYQNFIAAAIAARALVVPGGIDPLTLDDAEYRGPVMPWIDPQKEADAALSLMQAGLKSRSQAIRERGGNPDATNAEILRERRQDEQREMVFSSDWKHQARNILDEVTAQAEDEAA